MTSANSSAGGTWQHWIRHPAVIWIAGILAPPVGILLAWLHPSWSKQSRWIATGVMGVLLLGRMMGDDTKKPASEAGRQESATSAHLEDRAEQQNGAAEAADAGTPSHTSVAATATDSQGSENDKPIPGLGDRMRRGLFESEEAYRCRMFDRTVTAVLEKHCGMKCKPGPWAVVAPGTGEKKGNAYRTVVKREDGTPYAVLLLEKDYQFSWGAYEGSDESGSAVGFWKRDGTRLTPAEEGVVQAVATFEKRVSQTEASGSAASPHSTSLRNRRAPDIDNDMISKWTESTKRRTPVDMTRVFDVRVGMPESQILGLLGEPHKRETTVFKASAFSAEKELLTWTYRGQHSSDFIMLGLVNGRVEMGGANGWDLEKGFIGDAEEKKRIIGYYKTFLKEGGTPPFNMANPPAPGGT